MFTTEIVAETPDEGLFETLRAIQGQLPRESRNGPTVEFSGPATIVYVDPLKRVLFDETRDCNAFFALFESFHMLGGRQDLASIVYFNTKFGQYSDDGKIIRGSAYGQRWRHWFGHDQLETARKLFEKDGVDTRRSVIMQWDAASDPVVESKDIPCNTQCCLLTREGQLELTVFNRSNDVIFGTFGSNIVHFSMLLEYMGYLTDLPIGKYFQVSNCLHAYTEFDIYKKIAPTILEDNSTPEDRYASRKVRTSPMLGYGETVEQLDADIKLLLDSHAEGLTWDEPSGVPMLDPQVYQTSFFTEVVLPMMRAWRHYKSKKDARGAARLLQAVIDKSEIPYDWHVAGLEWMERRIK